MKQIAHHTEQGGANVPIASKHHRAVRKCRICHNKGVPQACQNLSELGCRRWHLFEHLQQDFKPQGGAIVPAIDVTPHR